ncbi:hypothetical protein E8E13_000181 [Curvularia kusanoi]|uniref:Ubiquitin-like-conjugating enzyme ATG10 n=1 Tax=Curvularia kusanoi TaxID=90978 RepID=A0A9P4T3V7_CURKU|nr:hypothetical protein E8E13_000181 [Curvularia kusanoi]
METQLSPAAPIGSSKRMQACLRELASFPHLHDSNFEKACSAMLVNFSQYGRGQAEWTALEQLSQDGTTFLRITKPLLVHADPLDASANDEEAELDEEDDDEVADRAAVPCPAVIQYDVVLSPSYRVPVLYFTVVDSQHRYPPTLETLYSCIIPPTFKTQAEHVGVIGGITLTDHPATNKPVFFIHPCQTADVMEASAGGQNINAYDYLLMWIGALGKHVGLTVPLSLVITDQRQT